jgi:hypothetical protein
MRVQREQGASFFNHACRLTAVSGPPRDFFERALMWAATGLFIAGALLATGSFLDWVSIEQLPDVIPANQAARADPFNGLEVGDGYWTLIAGGVLAVCAVLLVLRGSGTSARVAFVASIVGGAVAISDYRAIDRLFEEVEGIGVGITPGLGLTLASAGALLGLISSVAAIAATPRGR